jgi:hypothetical protein
MRLSLHVVLAMVLAMPVYAQQSPAKVQSDTSYHLLWYKGKKLKTNVLLTPRLDTVTYIPAKGKVKIVSKSGTGQRYDKMLAELNKTPQRMKEKMGELAARLPKAIVPHMAGPLQRAYSEVMDDYKDALANTIDLPEALTTTTLAKPMMLVEESNIQEKEVMVNNDAGVSKTAASTSNGGEYPATGILTDLPVDKDGDITLKVQDLGRLAPVREVLDYYERHKNDVISDVPVPPANSYSYCYICDTANDNIWDKEYEAFLDEMNGSDKRIMQQLFILSRTSELLFPAHLRAGIIDIINPILAWLMDRADKRCMLLAKKYGENPAYTKAVVMTLLAVDRQQQLMGFDKGNNENANIVIHALEKTAEIYIKAMKEYDYSIVLNPVTILGMDRQFQLLGGNPPVNTFDIITFNQFKMEFQITGKAAGDKGYQLAELKGKNWYAAIPDLKTCNLNWVLMGPDLNKLSAQLVAAEMKGGGGEINYVGTKSWEAIKPTMRIDFCEGVGKDSVEAFTFQAAGSNELWQYPAPVGVVQSANMNTVLTGCFIDVQRISEKAAYFKTPGNIEKMKQDMMKQYESLMKNGGTANAANMSAQDLQKMMKVANAMNASTRMGELVNTSNPASYLFQPVVRNKSKVVFKESLNGKELFPENSATVYAWFHLSFEQDPDSPYKVTDMMGGR